MEFEKRSSLSLAVLIVLMVVLACAWFLWANFLSFGNLQVIAETPFQVEVESGEVFSCTASPCEIKQKTGRQNIVISKDGLENEVKSVLVKLWKDSEVQIDFAFIPYLLEAPDYDPTSVNGNYNKDFKMVFDPEIGMQKLLDDQNNELVFFPERLNAPKVFASSSSAIVLSPDGNYRVSVSGKTRKGLGDIEVFDGKWSADGQYFLFQQQEGAALSILGPDNETRALEIDYPLEKMIWAADNRLLVFANNSQLHFYGSDGNLTNVVDFSIEEQGEIENPYIEPNLASVYFTVGEKGYRIILK